jgi:integrase
MCGGKRRDFGHGGYPDVSLQDARQSAREDRKLIRAGVDPAEQRKAAQDALRVARAKQRTFRQVAEVVIKQKKKEFRNGKHAAQWESTLETYAFPVIGNLPVHLVELAHVQNILEPLWISTTETATRLRGRIEAVLDYATVVKYRSGDNPARWRGNLDKVLPKPNKVRKVKHHPALTYEEVPAFMVELRAKDTQAAKALELQILTATRPGEVAGARWEEIDLQARLWTIPASRMKAEKEHEIPLSDAAVRLLKQLPRVSDYVFPGGRSLMKPQSTAAAMKLIKDLRPGITAHGMRSAFRDWAGEKTAYPREMIEHALAHQLKDKAEASYQRGTLMPKRARLMTAWATYCASTPAKSGTVTAIRGQHG